MLGGYATLNNGINLPLLGFGTYRITHYEDIECSIDCALRLGYRLIDTAAVYRNEEHIGRCLPTLLKKHNLERKDVFITTKLAPADHGAEAAVRAVQTSLSRLKMEYVDLYLIHWPGKQGLKREDPRNAQIRQETWSAIEDIHLNSNKLRTIGVSNYTHTQLSDLLSHCRVRPAVLQSEFHPDYQQNDVMEFCVANDIHFQSYSTLGSGHLVNDSRFSPVAEKHSKTIPQILLRWAIERGCSVIPKSRDEKRIEENSRIFDFALDKDDVERINGLEKNVKFCWDPTDVA